LFQPSLITSGTYNFYPTDGEIIIQAFSRIDIKRTEILSPHMQDAVAELNLLLTSMNNMGPNLAQVDLQSFPLVQGTPTYSILGETVQILDVFIRYSNPSIDRIVWPISRSEYAALPNKSAQGFPTQFWFDRLTSPTITLYLTPDGGGPYTLYYYRWRQVQDATVANGINPEVPNRFLDALVAGLAHRMARIYAPKLELQRKMDFEDAWRIASKQDTENVQMFIAPALMGYFR
jgi:hypothetical protein